MSSGPRLSGLLVSPRISVTQAQPIPQGRSLSLSLVLVYSSPRTQTPQVIPHRFSVTRHSTASFRVQSIELNHSQKMEELIPRSYQVEMYEKSMRRNTIVVVCLSGYLHPPHLTQIQDGHGQWEDTSVRYMHTVRRMRS
jgi:hypothetical protein